MAKHFIQKAIKPSHRGLFREKAERAGESTAEYAQQEEHAPGTLGHEARLAEILMHMNKK